MMRRTLVFTGVVALFMAIIFCIVGWSIKKPVLEKHRPERMPEKELQKEIEIVAMKEEATRSPEKPPKKRPNPKTREKTGARKAEKRSKNRKDREKVRKAENVSVSRKKKRPERPFPAHYQVTRQMIDTGRNLIDTKSHVPMVQASYERIGFDTYLREMKKMGGYLFVGDTISKKILARVRVMGNGKGGYAFSGLDEGNLDHLLSGMALFRPREISGEPLVDDILDFARDYYTGNLKCVVILPLDKEAAILGSLKEYLHMEGYDISQFDLIWGSYFQSGREFGLKLEKGRIGKTGQIVRLDMALTMSWG